MLYWPSMATPSVIIDHDRFVVICVIALCILLGSFVAVMACENPEWAFKLFGKHEKFEILKFLGVGMGGVLLTLQVWMSHKRAKAIETSASAQARATKEQAQANRNTEQGQRLERLKNAIEHLGHRLPFPLALNDSRSVLAVKGPLCRFAPWTAPGRSGRPLFTTRGKGGLLSGSSPREVVPDHHPAVESIS